MISDRRLRYSDIKARKLHRIKFCHHEIYERTCVVKLVREEDLAMTFLLLCLCVLYYKC